MKHRTERPERRTAATPEQVAAPPWWLLASESRAVLEFAAGAALRQVLQRSAPRGDGHPVLVLPGLGASDRSTRLLRAFLRDLGYLALPWEMGTNTGLRSGMAQRTRARLQALFDAHGKISLVGQSLGGIFARELAKLEPHLIRQVITLGSPFTGHPRATNATRLYEWLAGDQIDAALLERHARLRGKPPVPTTSVYSKLDGVVSWHCSIETGQPQSENIHLRGASHLGMASSPAALYLLAERLAQPEGHWTPFRPSGWQRLAYGVDQHHGAVPAADRNPGGAAA